MITFTNIAKQKLIHLISSNSGSAAYLFIKGGGCSGFNHIFEILKEDKKPNKIDETVEIDKNVNLHICGKSLLYIIGTEIDYIEDIMGSRFDFNNGNISGKCGCGTSVTFKN
jgi:iron-sulfur cluster assembly accessory protein|tara:strand:- start:1756 stop:2091 length:336 start_codon:yes stop_codon:yes gene_type:complete